MDENVLYHLNRKLNLNEDDSILIDKEHIYVLVGQSKGRSRIHGTQLQVRP